MSGYTLAPKLASSACLIHACSQSGMAHILSLSHICSHAHLVPLADDCVSFLQGVEETLCLNCAVARGHSRQSIKIMCSDNVRVLERLARYLEEHELLKGKNAGPPIEYLLPVCMHGGLAMVMTRSGASLLQPCPVGMPYTMWACQFSVSCCR